MTHLERELISQPEVWDQVRARAQEFLPSLPGRGQRVAVVGCGTSWFVAQAYAGLREARSHGTTDAFPASEFPTDRDYDHVVLISRSGTTSEVVQVMRALQDRGRAHSAIVAAPGTQIAQGADQAVVLDLADEQSVVQTRFATSALAVLRLSVGDDLETTIEQARQIVTAAPEELFGAELLEAEQVTFLGRAWSVGLAHEAALKLRESVQFWTESYPAMEYRHGPIAIATAGRAVWALGDLPEGLDGDIAATGAHLELHPQTDPMAELVRVHRYCLVRAAAAGLNPDEPRHLTRSIILA